MSATDGENCARLTLKVLAGIRNDECFENFYQLVELKRKQHSSVGPPTLPRKRKAPAKIQIGATQGTFHESPVDLYRQKYFEALDLIINTITDRFEQSSFKAYSKLENILLKTLRGENIEEDLEYLDSEYSDDVDKRCLIPQLAIFRTLFDDPLSVTCVHDIIPVLQTLAVPQRRMVSSVFSLCQLILVNPATSATSERSFSLARRLKTWLRNRASQQRFNNLAILNFHKKRTDCLNINNIANEFVAKTQSRKYQFGHFS